jgi:alcohol dehydrogenase, propanol-preferring
MIQTEAMVLKKQGCPLEYESFELRQPGEKEILIKVGACAVCRTDLHVIDGELKHPALPLVPGHELVGRVAATGEGVSRFSPGDRVAVAWLASTCGSCRFCQSSRENLCDDADFTGYTVNGGFARHAIAAEQFAFKLSSAFDSYADEDVAPLMCAGLIGWRSFKLASRGNYLAGGRRLGIYGFGAAGHLILQVASHFGWKTYAFTRDGDTSGQEFARNLGAYWSGGSSRLPEDRLDAAIIFAPAGELVPAGLKALDKGGVLVCGGIHMSDIPQFSYDLLWQERRIASVANLTREDGAEFLGLAPEISVRANISRYKLSDANKAIEDLRAGRLNGAAVLIMD